MASVIRESVIERDPRSCWDALRDFGALDKRLVPGFVTHLEMIGLSERRITFFTGAVATERLVGLDNDHMRLAYTVTESPMGSTHHNASAQVVPDGDARCRFVWITDVLPDELRERTGELMDAGIRVIKQTLEAASSAPS